MTTNNIGIVSPPRNAKTRGGADVLILAEDNNYWFGVYHSLSQKQFNQWFPVRWPKLVPFYNHAGESSLDLIEDISRVQITTN